MYKVEYLLLVDGEQASCKTVDSLRHLLQSDSDIVITRKGTQIIYKNNLRAGFRIVRGNAATDDGEDSQSVYFDIELTCETKADLQSFSTLLKAVHKVTAPILINPAALQVLWDDISAHYAEQAYPRISATENRMRKLITKFMHINVGIAWTEDRIPDDVQKSVRSSKEESTYLYNVDFIKLKDILLSESYSKHRDAFIKELKTSTKATFKREEIKALIPTSNWERYFSDQVGSGGDELASLWEKLYVLRCKVAHNKTFTLQDLRETKELTKKINPILDDAIQKLDGVQVDKDEAQDIVDDVVTTASKENIPHVNAFLAESRKQTGLVTALVTPLQKKGEGRTNQSDLKALLATGQISDQQYQKINYLTHIRNRLIHTINEPAGVDWEARVKDFKEINAHLEKVLASRDKDTQQKKK